MTVYNDNQISNDFNTILFRGDPEALGQLVELSNSKSDADRLAHLQKMSTSNLPLVKSAATDLLGMHAEGYSGFQDQMSRGRASLTKVAVGQGQDPTQVAAAQDSLGVINKPSSSTGTTPATKTDSGPKLSDDQQQTLKSMSGVMDQTGEGKKFYIGGNQHSDKAETDAVGNLLDGAGYPAKPGESLGDRVTRYQADNKLDTDAKPGPDTLKSLVKNQKDPSALSNNPTAQAFVQQYKAPAGSTTTTTPNPSSKDTTATTSDSSTGTSKGTGSASAATPNGPEEQISFAGHTDPLLGIEAGTNYVRRADGSVGPAPSAETRELSPDQRRQVANDAQVVIDKSNARRTELANSGFTPQEVNQQMNDEAVKGQLFPPDVMRRGAEMANASHKNGYYVEDVVNKTAADYVDLAAVSRRGSSEERAALIKSQQASAAGDLYLKALVASRPAAPATSSR
jgi:hypothetical protein